MTRKELQDAEKQYMTQQELQEIEERWKFGTNTREDVRRLIDKIREMWAFEARLGHPYGEMKYVNQDDGDGNDF